MKQNKGNVAEAQKAVKAILQHSVSTDEKPCHGYCPEGESSWCGWQREQAKGTQHCHHKAPLPVEVANILRPLFDRLSEPELLESAIDGFTQNMNKSFHHLLLDFCPKTVFTSSTVAIAAGLAVLQFNNGNIELSQVLKEMGIEPGAHCVSALHCHNYNCIIHASIKSMENTKLQRKRRADKKGLQDAQEAREGMQYASGQFIADMTLTANAPGPSEGKRHM